MPTFNQLVRKGRQQVTYKSTSPLCRKASIPFATGKRISVHLKKEEYVLQFVLQLPKSLTPHCVKSPVFVFPTVMK